MKNLARLLAILCVAIGNILMPGCQDKPCSDCSGIPNGAEVFVGKWHWDFTLMTSEYEAASQVMVDSIFRTFDDDVSIELTQDGCMIFNVDGKCEMSCIQSTIFERQEPSPYVCTDLMGLKLIDFDTEVFSYYTIECSIPNTLMGGGIYDIEKSFLSVPETLPGYEIVGFRNYYTRVQ